MYIRTRPRARAYISGKALLPVVYILHISLRLMHEYSFHTTKVIYIRKHRQKQNYYSMQAHVGTRLYTCMQLRIMQETHICMQLN